MLKDNSFLKQLHLNSLFLKIILRIYRDMQIQGQSHVFKFLLLHCLDSLCNKQRKHVKKHGHKAVIHRCETKTGKKTTHFHFQSGFHCNTDSKSHFQRLTKLILIYVNNEDPHDGKKKNKRGQPKFWKIRLEKVISTN